MKYYPLLKWNKTTVSIIFSCMLASGINAQNTQITTREAKRQYSTINMSRTSVHDPSVVYDTNSKQYYIFGSHTAVASTKDLQNWSWVNVPWEINDNNNLTTVNSRLAFRTNNTKEIIINGEKVEFGNFDASAWNCAFNDESWIDGNMWAPDIIFNPTMNKWCQYLSLNGPKWNSCIILLTSDNIEGPYIYEGPVVYTGFRNRTEDEISYKKTDLELIIGTKSSLPSKYNQGDKWGDIWPHAIDPCTFFDEDGKLWMAYGSWSGGIYILELDQTTGLRNYDITYTSDYDSKKAAVTSDEYFGKKIAGGCYVSGEGPYIQYIGNYYYLFVTNGGYGPNEGYEMRIFRSEKPDGPYVDLNNISAIYSNWAYNYGTGDTRGSKLMGGYKWGFMEVGECAQGHNSAIVGPDGNTYLVYHTKFNDGSFGHQVRVHQIFMNKKEWPVIAPFEYNGETINENNITSDILFSNDEIIGSYNIIRHRYGMDFKNYEEANIEKIELNENGTVTGDFNGTWSVEDNSYYLTLKLGNTTYDGIVLQQQIEPTSIQALCLSACNNAGVNLWGYKIINDKDILSYNINNLVLPFNTTTVVTSNINLYDLVVDDKIEFEWSSANPEIISNTGKYNPSGLTGTQSVVLTLKLSCGDYYWTNDYRVYTGTDIYYPGDYLTGLKGFYDFNSIPVLNAYNNEHEAILKKNGTNQLPTLEEDKSRIGNVLHQYFGANGNCSYTEIVNPLKNENLDGATISMWLKRNDDVAWDAIWSFFDPSENCRLYMTGNTYIGFNNGIGSWLDINHPSSVISDNIPVNKWTLVTITLSRNNGLTMYIDGNRVEDMIYNGVSSGSSVNSESNNSFDYNLILDFIQNCPNFYLGYGSFWGTADVSIDDVMIYNRELNLTDVETLNKKCNQVTDFTGGISSGITDIKTDSETEIKSAFDLQGRAVKDPRKGIYIINGNKRVIK